MKALQHKTSQMLYSCHILLLLKEGYRPRACDQRGREEILQNSMNPSHSNLQKLQVVFDFSCKCPSGTNYSWQLLPSFHPIPSLPQQSPAAAQQSHHPFLISPYSAFHKEQILPFLCHFIPWKDLVLPISSSHKSLNTKVYVVIVELPGYPGLVTCK